MNPESKLHDLAISDSGFVFDPYSGATFSVNESGRLLLDGLKRGLDREALVHSLREHFEVGSADLERDVDDFVQVLKKNGVLPADLTLS